MSLINKGVVFHDIAGGGYYCNGCKRYLHPDIIHSHKCKDYTGYSRGYNAAIDQIRAAAKKRYGVQ